MSLKRKDEADLSGILGESASLRKVAGRVVITNRPKKRMVGEPSQGQEAFNKRFLGATRYAKLQLESEGSKAMYKSGVTPAKRSAYLVAVTDYLVSPEVVAIDTKGYKGAIGDTIIVKAIDDFRVVRVQVTITGSDGAEIESGEAKLLPDLAEDWQYKATVANTALLGTTIRALAYDKPRNVGELSIVL